MAITAPKNENIETVSGLNKRIKRALEGDFSFMGIHLRGEVSNFKKYLFTYCGTLSLSKEMRPVHISKAQPGDLVLYGGSPGHAVTIMDILHEKNGKKIKLMFSQSYMPAQEIEILANRYENNSPWFELEDLDDPDLMIDTPEWTFTGNKVMRWADL